jgi:hypothetical protein
VAQDAEKYRRKKKATIRAFPQPSEGSRKSELIVTSHEDIRMNATLEFMQVHKRAKTWLKDFKSQRYQRAVVVRDENLAKRLEAHNQAVKEGRSTPENAIESIFGMSIEDGTF